MKVPVVLNSMTTYDCIAKLIALQNRNSHVAGVEAGCLLSTVVQRERAVRLMMP
jgi:hypothetical protein